MHAYSAVAELWSLEYRALATAEASDNALENVRHAFTHETVQIWQACVQYDLTWEIWKGAEQGMETALPAMATVALEACNQQFYVN